MARNFTPLLAVFLSGCCCLGSCPDGNTEAELFLVTPPRDTTLETITYPVQRVRVAPGTVHELEIEESSFSLFGRDPSVLTEATFDDPKIAAVSGKSANTVTIEGLAEGTTQLNITAEVGKESLSDRFEVAVTEPNVVKLTDGCPYEQPYWTGMPAFVRYERLYFHPENYAAYPFRIWGTGRVPLAEHPDLRLIEASRFELKFDGPDEPKEVILKSSLEAIDHYNVPAPEMTLEFQEPPSIKGIRWIDVGSGRIVDQPYAHRDLVSRFRAYPVGSSNEQMCNTTIPVQIRSKNEGSCVVRAWRATKKVAEFSSVASAADGIFELKGLVPGRCVLEITVLAGAAKLLAEGVEELVLEQEVMFYSNSGSGGGLPSLDGIDIDDD